MRLTTLLVLAMTCGSAMAEWNWVQTVPSHPRIDLQSVSWTGTEWIALGPNGTMLASANSVDWTYRDSKMLLNPKSLVVADQWMAAICESGIVYTSRDGKVWTYRETGATWQFSSGASNGKLMVLIGPNGTLVTSADGITWKKKKLATDQALSCVAWAGDRWVVVAPGGLTYVSTDGDAWTSYHTSQFENPQFLVWTGKILVMNDYKLVTSVDGSTWVPDTRYELTGLRSPVWAGTHLIAVKEGFGAYEFMRSTEGLIWESFREASNFSAFAWAGGTLVTVGTSGQIFTSTDEKVWTPRLRYPTRKTLVSLAASDSMLVAVGALGALLTSRDGSEWTERDSRTPNDFAKVIWNGTKFYAVDKYGVILTSRDGKEWKDESPANRVPLLDLIWAGDRFISPTGTGMRTSLDGVTWTDQDTGFSDYALTTVAWNGKRFFAGGQQYFTSADGKHWERIPGKDDAYAVMGSMACNASICVSVGYNETGSYVIKPEGKGYSVAPGGGRSMLSVLWTGKRFLQVGLQVVRWTSDGVDGGTFPVTNMKAAARLRDSLFLVGSDGVMYVTRDEQSSAVKPRLQPRRVPELRTLAGSVRLDLGGPYMDGTRAAIYTLAGSEIRGAYPRFEGSVVEFPTGGLAPGVYRIEAMRGGKRVGRIFCLAR